MAIAHYRKEMDDNSNHGDAGTTTPGHAKRCRSSTQLSDASSQGTEAGAKRQKTEQEDLPELELIRELDKTLRASITARALSTKDTNNRISRLEHAHFMVRIQNSVLRKRLSDLQAENRRLRAEADKRHQEDEEKKARRRSALLEELRTLDKLDDEDSDDEDCLDEYSDGESSLFVS